MSTTDFPLQLKRQYAGSIDPDLVFPTEAAMNAYLSSPRRYAGQIVSCPELENAFILNANRDEWLPLGGSGGGSTTQVVNNIPTTLDPGQRVWVKETQSEWIGANEDFFPTLDPGTPWPVRGYKVVDLNIKVGLLESGITKSWTTVTRCEIPTTDLNIHCAHGEYVLNIPESYFLIDTVTPGQNLANARVRATSIRENTGMHPFVLFAAYEANGRNNMVEFWIGADLPLGASDWSPLAFKLDIYPPDPNQLVSLPDDYVIIN
ncbi:MAG: hypothetical protein LAT67_05150 [Balneolales bacterium]|nr:hypothetical protein [Balneolales bacterium]